MVCTHTKTPVILGPMTTAIWWMRRDIRLTDNPALVAAATADHIIPLFIFDDALLHGRHSSGPRVAFMLQCLTELKTELKNIGVDLVVRHGKPEDVLAQVARETGASQVHFAADVSPYARKRDHEVADRLQAASIAFHAHSGLTALGDLNSLVAASSGNAYSVFSPFYNAWSQLDHRGIVNAPTELTLPAPLDLGNLPTLDELKLSNSTHSTIRGGEVAAQEVLTDFMSERADGYVAGQNELSTDTTSHLSAYLHFGVLSPRQVEEAVPHGQGGDAFIRQIAWRDFYHYILWHNPSNARHEFQTKYRNLSWNFDEILLEAWKNGQTGYPLIDAGMRQLKAEGWMHNRARLAVGSFLTKDLGIDWREGERHFMHWLIDGDEASNNGNWQWIASVGTDPAPLFRRLYNPTLHLKRYDPDFSYTRKYVPELSNVPAQYMLEPWTMPADIQKASNCIMGSNYPTPIVDHKQAREETIERYKI